MSKWIYKIMDAIFRVNSPYTASYEKLSEILEKHAEDIKKAENSGT